VHRGDRDMMVRHLEPLGGDCYGRIYRPTTDELQCGGVAHSFALVTRDGLDNQGIWSEISI